MAGRAFVKVFTYTDISDEQKKSLRDIAGILLTVFTLFGGIDAFTSKYIAHKVEIFILGLLVFFLLLVSFILAQTASMYGSLKLSELLINTSYILIPILAFLYGIDFARDYFGLKLNNQQFYFAILGLVLIECLTCYNLYSILRDFLGEVKAEYQSLKAREA